MTDTPGQPTLTTPLAPAPAGGAQPGFANGSLVGGKYLVEETVAEGGIGVVVAARHLALDQRVAIKHLKPKALENPSLVERFVREARLAAQISSEHVVRVFDVGSLPDGGPYMVMEYLHGQDLGSLLASGPLSIPRAVDYIVQACDALAEAHVLRIVHRDIKPENLFLAERPSNTPILKIIDFGISKVAPTRGDGDSWAHETAANERFGTPLYMSPEQLRSSSNVDARTDIWALGVTLYELVTGRLPFEGTDLPQLCTSVLTAPPTRLTTVIEGAPPLLEAILLKCLEKDPDLRFEDVAQVAEALAPFGPPSAAARAERIREVIRRGGANLPRLAPIPAEPDLVPVALEAARALGRETPSAGAVPSVGRETLALKAVATRIPMSSRPPRPAIFAGLGLLACAAAFGIMELQRPLIPMVHVSTDVSHTLSPGAGTAQTEMAIAGPTPAAVATALASSASAPSSEFLSPRASQEVPRAAVTTPPLSPVRPPAPALPSAQTSTVRNPAHLKRRELFGGRE